MPTVKLLFSSSNQRLFLGKRHLLCQIPIQEGGFPANKPGDQTGLRQTISGMRKDIKYLPLELEASHSRKVFAALSCKDAELEL